MSKWRPSTWPLIASWALYGLCLTQSGFDLDSGDPQWSPGYVLLALGWLAALTGIFAWFANPLLLAALICGVFRAWRATTVLAVVALLVALSFLRVDQIVVSEAPTYAKVARLGPGYWLWLASMIVCAGAGLAGMAEARAAKRAGS